MVFNSFVIHQTSTLAGDGSWICFGLEIDVTELSIRTPFVGENRFLVDNWGERKMNLDGRSMGAECAGLSIRTASLPGIRGCDTKRKDQFFLTR